MADPVTISENIGQILAEQFKEAVGPLYVVSPFISPAVLSNVFGRTQSRSAVIVTSWRADHLLAGVSHLDVFPLCKKRGWSLFVNNKLHAKCYSDGLRSAWIGSANLTSRGFGMAENSNSELLCFLDPAPQALRLSVYRILAESQLVTVELYRAYVQWLEEQEVRTPVALSEPNFEGRGLVDPFLVSQLPASHSPRRFWECLTGQGEKPSGDELLAAEHDLVLYGVAPLPSYTEFAQSLGMSFLQHPFINALTSFVSGNGKRFGAVKAWIQDNCTTVPEPYRRDLTAPVQHIYRWLQDLAPNLYEVTRPGGHSEVLRYTG